MPSLTPRRPPRPPPIHSISEGIRRIRGTAEVVGIAKDTQWPVGPAPEPLSRTIGRSRDSDSSEESDSNSSIDGSSPASSLSSPVNGGKNVLPLHGIDEVAVDQQEFTIRLLSWLRDLWELSSGYISLSDHYISPESVTQPIEIDDFAEGLGIKLDEVDEKAATEESVDVIKKVIGETGVKRANIVKEIIDTEESYIRGLQELIEVMIIPQSWTNFRFTLIILSLHYRLLTSFESFFVTLKLSSTFIKISSYPHSSKQPNKNLHPLTILIPFHSPAMPSAQYSKKKSISWKCILNTSTISTKQFVSLKNGNKKKPQHRDSSNPECQMKDIPN